MSETDKSAVLEDKRVLERKADYDNPCGCQIAHHWPTLAIVYVGNLEEERTIPSA